nr:sporulation-specific protein 5 [Quercus suber]
MGDKNTTGPYKRVSGNFNANNKMYGRQYDSLASTGHGYGMTHLPNADISALAHSFQGMNMQNQNFVAHAKNAMMSTGNGYSGVGVAGAGPSIYGTTSQYVYPNNYGVNNGGQPANMYAPHASQYMHQMGYSTYPHHDNSPMSQGWTPTTATTGEVPTLITPRRDSISSNENDQPATPSYAGYPGFGPAGVTINRSPSGVFTHSTPSPTSLISTYGIPATKQFEQIDVSPRIKLLLAREPAIPRAIPAPSSPLKPLDRALENQRGETNVYIRGLLPETTDAQLEDWGSRFGDIKSSKSIIDLNTGLCKGYVIPILMICDPYLRTSHSFGFVKYHNYEDAENCIRGFHYLGYELKTFADEGNTNLYVSNLPKSMNEHELANLFAPHKVCSSRILRDKNGHGRGVGFARFESRDDCEAVIKIFHNTSIESTSEEMQIQIRYADTQEQKSLKQQTQAARQFRSAEYEWASQNCRPAGRPNEFEQYLGTHPTLPIQGQRWAQSAMRQAPAPRSPLVTSSAPDTAVAGGSIKVENTDRPSATDQSSPSASE